MRGLRRRRSPDPALLLLRSVCHELRPPMATLASLVRALETTRSEPRHSELARLAAEHASHAEAVLRQAAAAAQGLDAGAEHPVPLHRVLPAATAVVPGDRLTVAVTQSAGRCLVPPQHLRQILINLLTNAAAYAPSGTPIRLRARTDLCRLRLTVADAGRPNRDLTVALNRRTPPPDSNGLGLWVVRHLAARHGGSVRARALSPSGLAVEVSLPRRPK
ncbi:sensor histidine kinase [Jidongwangia harbinensis]|uniref:sensor histidine kinase n=1 Tax=Jidongwangia harbinensis TaxID=2878561 RepID=UPI002342CAC5|nr:ATP-binding protein [Jidongwangia harbinensis]